jgi:hypothetical protein
MGTMNDLIPAENIDHLIFLIRGQKVMLDKDLAQLYGVPTKRLNEQVRRNRKRFPPDFMFQMSKAEMENWRSQFATSNSSLKMGLRRPPYVFTEHGVAMLSSVLNSDRAVEINIMIMRAFIRLRQMVSLNRALAKRLAAVERRLTGHDADILHFYQVIQNLTRPERIGFKRVP